MITIHHNFDETKFMWLWAKYVKAGNIEKHCTACMIGPYSKKFSGSSNHDLLSQETMVMDEFPEDSYEAIYFCGVLKKGYLNKNPEKNNYAHNVHFAIRPFKGKTDVWDFENWHVKIENGVLEHIPATYELGDKFFMPPYTSHYYTCRIFRWMVGHFYPQELRDTTFGLPDMLTTNDNTESYPRDPVVKLFVQEGYKAAQRYFEDEYGDSNCDVWYNQREDNKAFDIPEENCRKDILRRGLFNRHSFFSTCVINDWMMFDHEGKIIYEDGKAEEVYLAYLYNDDGPFTFEIACNLFSIGVNEYLDMIAPYQERDMFFNPRGKSLYDKDRYIKLIDNIWKSRKSTD